MTAIGLALVVLAVVRVTRLVVGDEITLGFRQSVTRRWPYQNKPIVREFDSRPEPGTGQLTPQWPTRLLNCQWCVSLWLSLAAALLAHASGFVPTWTETVWAWPGIAGAAGLLGVIWS